MIYLYIYSAICLLIYIALVIITKLIDGRIKVKDLIFLFLLSICPIYNLMLLAIGITVLVQTTDLFDKEVW